MLPPRLGSRNFLKNKIFSNGNPNNSFKVNNVDNFNDNPKYTGRYLLIMDNNSREVIKVTHQLEKKWGLLVASTADFSSSPPNESQIKDADVLLYDELGIALVGVEDEKLVKIEEHNTAFMVVPEKVVYIPDRELIYTPELNPIESSNFSETTWGIRLTEAMRSAYNGGGIKVAVLDTGFDINHPDFQKRQITTISFVLDESIDDLHGHGTHCIGVACGCRNDNGTRYGVATHAHIFAGKVLSNEGSGAQSWVLSGMAWAVKNGCKVISMSLGSPVSKGDSFDIAYERAAGFALSKGTLIIAAAGNDSQRSKQLYSPVSSPADCPSILAVGAIDPAQQVGDFSNRAVNSSGLVDFAAPGVGIYSSWPMPLRYRTITGTSMATPHVAGIAALYFEKYPDGTPEMIERELRKNALPLPFPPEDVGAGVSIAP